MRKINEKIPAFIKEYIREAERKGTIFKDKITLENIETIKEHFVKTQNDIPNFLKMCDYNPDLDNLIIVGDIHGDLKSFKKAIRPFLDGKVEGIIFLGDYVDRGPQSLECLLLVASLSISWPRKIIPLRGNHEDIENNARYGFKDDLRKRFLHKEFFNRAIEEIDQIYNYFSLAVLTNQRSLCVHGGIPKGMDNFQMLNKIPKPHFKLATKFKDEERGIRQKLHEFMEQIRWNDPIENRTKEFSPSFRGFDFYKFNMEALEHVLEKNNAKRLIRAHESSRGGYEKMFEGKLIHIFSAEPYYGQVRKASVLQEKGKDTSILRDLDFKKIKKF